jgi:ketosteroid isomerase-like protein
MGGDERMRELLRKRVATWALCLAIFGFTGNAFSQTAASGEDSSGKSAKPGPSATIDKAYLQKIWDGWGTLNAAGQKKYYAQGPHVFFDDEPLKYSSWDEYQATTTKEFEEYKSGHFTVNDDAQIHKNGNLYWCTATVALDMTQKSGKREQSTLRWTAIFEKQNGKWLIVHEHVSVPQQ